MPAQTDLVGAFINGELRGEGSIIDFEGATYVNMTVYLAGGRRNHHFHHLFDAVECATCNISAELTTHGLCRLWEALTTP